MDSWPSLVCSQGSPLLVVLEGAAVSAEPGPTDERSAPFADCRNVIPRLVNRSTNGPNRKCLRTMGTRSKRQAGINASEQPITEQAPLKLIPQTHYNKRVPSCRRRHLKRQKIAGVVHHIRASKGNDNVEIFNESLHSESLAVYSTASP